ncbi:hypothetical protein ACC870_38600, partial [Rhizobium ruizarguesonis]
MIFSLVPIEPMAAAMNGGSPLPACLVRSCLDERHFETRKSIGERLAQLEAQRKTLQIRLSKQERAIDTRR